ncbi:3-oxo-isoapionate kinase OiaK [Azohydromonas lata]|uniref:3-oxo-isoapionate kinase OiaK n=1 Tax=Azohydromonas lata TaxID=45677 RepID=A0ABU5IDW8_9BURK|nr:3-oxo-isoapionate kinase OiaK [Azohydromonas lata]MDZ5456710.1 3-oxo-isoapionate kinase OiaK [Azohydromonas lata]
MSAAREGAPQGLLLAYYGDDFTGSTDAMEAMTAAGVPTVLFLQPPTPAMLQRFPHVRCVGLAGSSRGRSPQWMEQHLPQAFESLAGLGAPVLHYKVCSTFDSSPAIGSIGRAIDLGQRCMPGRWVPMVVGAPRLKRYQAFGNLFAAADGAAWRLDRHPTMSRHPVTPMGEADLRRHLAAQTARRIELIDLVQLKAGEGTARVLELCGDDVPAVFLDVVDEQTLQEAGRLVWEQRGDGVFTASSSGLQYALAAHWRSLGWLPATAPGLPTAEPVSTIAAVSGSCSPVTAAQIRWARANGFLTERLHLPAVLHSDTAQAEVERCVRSATAALRAGTSALVYSAEGPDDPAVTGFDALAAEAGLDRPTAARRVGEGLAQVMRRLLDSVELRRVVVAGGDSSGEVASALDIAALSVVAGMAPGAPLCRAWSANPRRDGLEIVLKGGQIGAQAFFGAVRAGRPAP